MFKFSKCCIDLIYSFQTIRVTCRKESTQVNKNIPSCLDRTIAQITIACEFETVLLEILWRNWWVSIWEGSALLTRLIVFALGWDGGGEHRSHQLELIAVKNETSHEMIFHGTKKLHSFLQQVHRRRSDQYPLHLADSNCWGRKRNGRVGWLRKWPLSSGRWEGNRSSANIPFRST